MCASKSTQAAAPAQYSIFICMPDCVFGTRSFLPMRKQQQGKQMHSRTYSFCMPDRILGAFSFLPMQMQQQGKQMRTMQLASTSPFAGLIVLGTRSLLPVDLTALLPPTAPMFIAPPANPLGSSTPPTAAATAAAAADVGTPAATPAPATATGLSSSSAAAVAAPPAPAARMPVALPAPAPSATHAAATPSMAPVLAAAASEQAAAPPATGMPAAPAAPAPSLSTAARTTVDLGGAAGQVPIVMVPAAECATSLDSITQPYPQVGAIFHTESGGGARAVE